MDIWTTEKRSSVMRKIRGVNTKPEMIFRKSLFRLGYRYSLHRKNLPGKPDVVLPKYKTVIFVHGCFWHFHQQCREGRIPSTNSDFWSKKMLYNVSRDKMNIERLKIMGWKVIEVWECEIEKNIEKTLNKVVVLLRR